MGTATEADIIRRRMALLSEEIRAHLTDERTADDFDSREWMWMERENLRAELERA